MDENALINQHEIARMLGVSPRLILKLAREGKIPSIKVGKFVRFKKSSILKWIRENEKSIYSPNGDNKE